jgi:hypothetical protein
MATDTVEGDRVLKVRKQFADERQNHKLSPVYLLNARAGAMLPA